MKPFQLSKLLVLALTLVVAATACRKTPVRPMDIRGRGPGGLPETETPAIATPGPGPTIKAEDLTSTTPKTPEGIPIPGPGQFDRWGRDFETLKPYAVYFDYDSAVIKSGEKPKLNAVAEWLKAHPSDALRIEGNCDERGTEGYNQALGERRALATREALVELGIDANHIETVSNGKDKPVAQGHDESAWRLNRRDDFIVLTPPAGK
jgi:peptidoglycan-associated lipoprotein